MLANYQWAKPTLLNMAVGGCYGIGLAQTDHLLNDSFSSDEDGG